MEKEINERRKYKRLKHRMDVVYKMLSLSPQATSNRHSVEIHEAETADISPGGLQLIVETQLSDGIILRLVLNLENRNKPLHVFAKTKWSNFDSKINKYGAGVEFLYLKDKDKELLHKLTYN